MKRTLKPVLFFSLIMMAASALYSCSKPKEAKVVVSEHEFAIRKLNDYAYTIDARGKVKNIGEVDVKKVVVTAYCRDCSNGFAQGKWLVTERERAPEEMEMINYLVAGGEAEFSFTDVAVIYNVPETPKEMPKQMEVVIQSFEVVD